jgi:hypothetical protein
VAALTVVRPSPAPWDAFAALLSACMWLLEGGEGARGVRNNIKAWVLVIQHCGIAAGLNG